MITHSTFDPAPLPSGTRELDGRTYWIDGRGALVPADLVRPTDQLEDETVRRVMGYALALSEQVARFKSHTFEDIGAFDALLAQEHQTAKGGAKGNKTLMTFDGTMKVEVRVADQIDFGPELQIAKTLVDECLMEWAADSRPELQAVVQRAFNTDKEGLINRAEIFTLLRLNIDDERWRRAMEAIRNAIRVVGSKTYVRAWIRDGAGAPWQAVTIDLAKA